MGECIPQHDKKNTPFGFTATFPSYQRDRAYHWLIIQKQNHCETRIYYILPPNMIQLILYPARYDEILKKSKLSFHDFEEPASVFACPFRIRLDDFLH